MTASTPPIRPGKEHFTAWVRDDRERLAHERRLRGGLVGHRIRAVRYVELRYGEPPEANWAATAFDSVDFGIELDLDGGHTASMTWQQAGYNEGLLITPRPLAAEIGQRVGVAVWDVTNHWAARTPMAITDIDTTWQRHGYGPAFNQAGERVADGGESDLCLITVVLQHSMDDGVVVTLGERARDGSFTYMHDNVAVFLSVADAARAGVGVSG